jgi:hypothetical protein
MKKGDYIKILGKRGLNSLIIGNIYLVIETRNGFHKLVDNDGRNYDWACSYGKNIDWELVTKPFQTDLYSVGDWVKVIYTDDHCHGFKGDTMDLQIILWNSDLWLNSNNEISYTSQGGTTRWNSFRTQEGKPVLFSSGENDYIVEKINISNNYEVY